MMKSIFLAGALALAVGMTGALAQRIENREDRQKARTRQGVKSGGLATGPSAEAGPESEAGSGGRRGIEGGGAGSD